MRALLLAVLLVAAGAVTGSLARADGAVPLTGENLSSVQPGIFSNASCVPQGSSGFDFQAAGAATGPYPGTFSENGSVQLGPLTNVGATNFGFDLGTVTGFSSSFQIQSGDTTITGTKHLSGPPDPDLGQGTCTNFSGLTIQVGQTTITNASGTYVNFSSTVSYDATITSPTGTSQVTGLAFTQGSQLDVSGICSDTGQPCEQHLSSFGENFITSSPVNQPPPPAPAALVLSPPAATNAVGTTHTVTATVLDQNGNPFAGTTVRFTVSGSTSATGSCTTGSDGSCSFTYLGPRLPGADLITAYADSNGNGTADAGEPTGTATKAWILPASTPGQTTGGGQAAPPTNLNASVTFGFVAQTNASGPTGTCNVVDKATGTKVKCLDVTALVLAGTHATFFGNATVNGVATTYRIDVDDLGEGSSAPLQDTFTIQTASGYTAGGLVTNGNVQVHPA